MKYRLVIYDQALNQLRALPKNLRQNIGARLDLLQTNLSGDVKKLSGKERKYRLRVGSYRVLFTVERDTIFIYALKDRKEAYE